MKSKSQILLLFVLLLAGFLVRFYKINSPIADWHSFRQADTASVTDNFLKNGPNLLYPTYHDLSNVQSGLDNPRGLRFVEFPLYNLLCFTTAKILPFPPTISYRLTSIFISLLSSFTIFLIALKYSRNFLVSVFSLSAFLFLPFNIYYSRAILPEPLAVLLMLLALYFFDSHLLLSSLFFSLGLLVKPFIGFVIFPTLLILIFIHKPYFINHKSLLVIFIVSLVPFLLWRFHISHFPQAIPYSKWLFNTQKQYLGPHNWSPDIKVNPLVSMISFKPYWWRWLFYERIGNLILGSFGLIPLFLGLAYRHKHLSKISFSLIAGIILYFIVVAGGNIQHDYYQILIIPSLSLLLGLGLFYQLRFVFKNPLISLFSLLIVIIFSLGFSFYQIKEFYKINNPSIIAAGLAAHQLLPPNALVIAPYNGDTALLYQTHRSGWPIEIYDLPSLQNQHPQNPIYLVSVNLDDYTNKLIKEHPPIYQNNQFVILSL